MTFARNVLAAREAAGLTQRELARRTGASRNHVSEVEQDARNVTLAMVTRYARALGVSELDLLTPQPKKPLKL
jgi:transcriptional regulator with XRE-family HTH domain